VSVPVPLKAPLILRERDFTLELVQEQDGSLSRCGVAPLRVPGAGPCGWLRHRAGHYACIAWAISSAIPNSPSRVNSAMGCQSGA